MCRRYYGFLLEHLQSDHVHILFETSPQTQLSKLINNYKTVTSRLLRKEFSDTLEPYYWEPHFWSDTYFISSVSDTSEAVIRKYIQDQGKKKTDWPRLNQRLQTGNASVSIQNIPADQMYILPYYMHGSYHSRRHRLCRFRYTQR